MRGEVNSSRRKILSRC